MKKFGWIVLCLFSFALAGNSNKSIIITKIVKVYDGDTFYADLYDLPDVFGKNIGIRLIGIDTPEMTSKDSCLKAQAKSAKEYFYKRLSNARKVELTKVSRDKYFRLDAVVLIDGVNINQEMIDKGFAKEYTGEGSRPIFDCPKKGIDLNQKRADKRVSRK